MPHCQCLYEMENGLPITQHCFTACSDQFKIMENRRLAALEVPNPIIIFMKSPAVSFALSAAFSDSNCFVLFWPEYISSFACANCSSLFCNSLTNVSMMALMESSLFFGGILKTIISFGGQTKNLITNLKNVCLKTESSITTNGRRLGGRFNAAKPLLYEVPTYLALNFN